MAIKIIYSLQFPMATNSFPLPSKLISIILIQWFPARKTLNNIIIFFFSEIYILKYLSPLFLLNTLFVNWKLSFLYWELNSSVILTLIFCECLKLIMVLLGTPWQIVSQDWLQFTSHNESDRQMAHRHTHTHINTSFIY